MSCDSPIHWRRVQLQQVAHVTLGGTPSTRVYEYWNPPEVDWVTAKDVSNFPVAKIDETERKISELGLEKSNAKLLPALTTVIIARGATTGKVRMLGREMAINQTCYGIVPKEEADPVFIYYYFNYLYEHLRKVAHGSVFDTVTTDTLNALEIYLPPFPEQRAIVHILGALDDKIELNRRMNETLEAIARAIFKSWFVDFDPVWAKVDGEQPYGMDAETAALFPDAFVDSEFGSIPQGWQVKDLPEVFEINPPRSLSKGESAPYLPMADMPTSSALPEHWGMRGFTSGMRFVNGDVLVARITPCLENGKTAFVHFLKEGEVGWGSTEYIVFRSKPPLPLEYAYFLARTRGFRSHAIANMTGTSGRQRVPKSCFDHFPVVAPLEPVAARFGEIVGTIVAKMKQSDDQSRTLAELRDTLLPKLISGEVRVPEAEEIV